MLARLTMLVVALVLFAAPAAGVAAAGSVPDAVSWAD